MFRPAAAALKVPTVCVLRLGSDTPNATFMLVESFWNPFVRLESVQYLPSTGELHVRRPSAPIKSCALARFIQRYIYIYIIFFILSL